MEQCFYECGREANTTDHIIPVELGGASVKENYIPACYICNGTRGHKTIEQFAAEIGLDKPLPQGISDIEWKLTRYPIESLTIYTCIWCERPRVTVKPGPNDTAVRKFCSDNHRKAYKRRGRARLSAPI